MNDLPTFARPGVPQPNFAPQRPPAPTPPAAPMPPKRPQGLGMDWAGMTKAPYTPEMQGAMDSPQGAFAQPPAPAPAPAPVQAPAAAPQPAMRGEQIDMSGGNIFDEIGGFLQSLFAQRQAPPGMQWDSMQGWVPEQKGPR
jgi:hypothetical protein